MVKNPVAKIQPSEKGTDAAKLADIIINSIQEKKGNDILSLNLGNIDGAVSDYFIICHGNSTTQVEAIASFVEEEVRKKGKGKVWNKEGYENLQWILLDYVDVVVHIFLKETREFYNIEGLWADAETIEIQETQIKEV